MSRNIEALRGIPFNFVYGEKVRHIAFRHEQEHHQSVARRRIDDTALHEATHTGVAEANGKPVKMATVVPTAHYNGLTVLDGTTDVLAALAPHATGHSGTGHDIRVVRHMGFDPGSLEGAARSVVEKNANEIQALAIELEEKRTLNGPQIRDIISKTRQAKKEGPGTIETATVSIENDKGTVEKVIFIRKVNRLNQGAWTRVGR